jgi:hypothetical protein
MKIINSRTHGLALIREEEYRNLFREVRPEIHEVWVGMGQGYKVHNIDGIIVLEWDIFERMLWYVPLGWLSEFFRKQTGFYVIEHASWKREKIRPESEVREFISDHLFTELEEAI